MRLGQLRRQGHGPAGLHQSGFGPVSVRSVPGGAYRIGLCQASAREGEVGIDLESAGQVDDRRLVTGPTFSFGSFDSLAVGEECLLAGRQPSLHRGVRDLPLTLGGEAVRQNSQNQSKCRDRGDEDALPAPGMCPLADVGHQTVAALGDRLYVLRLPRAIAEGLA